MADRTKPPFRADHVGSLLRPARLHTARAERDSGELDAAGKRVVVIGHSAGGTMALRSYTAAPELFFGVISVAAPMAPTSKHRKAPPQ